MAEMSSEKVAAGLANPVPPAKREQFLAVALVVISLVVMGGGGHFTVEGARDLAGWLNITESSIGLSLVAFATAAEMLFLAVVPALKGHPEISLGGILGSYAYNATLSLGVAALVGPLLAPESTLIAVSSLFMVGLLALLLLMLWKGRLGRLDGAALVLLYGAYLATVFVL
jgi:cation:H+ antiporter